MRKRFILIVLVLFVLSSIVPDAVNANGWTKEVDVFFGGFQLRVNGKKIPYHKEPFIYDGEFYVSLDDLAKGLEIDMIKKNSSIYLDSKGKLDKTKDTSKQPLAFQRGYEIMAKENIIEGLIDDIRALNDKGPGAINYELGGNMKKISVGFGNMDIYLDGESLVLHSEPILYKNNTYINVDSIAPHLYITPNLSKNKKSIDIDTNGVLVSDNTYSSVDTLLAVRENRNYLLDLQRAELERKLYILKELQLPYGKINNTKDLKEYLNENFSKIGSLNVEFDVVKQSNWIDLDISFSKKQNFNWYKLNRPDVESWIWNIYSSILNLYDEDALLSGSIINPYHSKNSSSSWKNYVTFYTKDNDIYFDFTKSRLGISNSLSPGYLMEVLNTKLNTYRGVDFRYETSISGDSLDLTAYADNSRFKSFHVSVQMGYLRSINNIIRELYPDLTVEGKIVYPDDRTMPSNFYIEENRVRSRELMDKTEDYLNAKFNKFSYGQDDFILSYSLYEKDLKNFQLIVEADFSVEDDKWINAGIVGKQRLDSNVHNAISYIFSLWDANVSTEVLDKNGVVISEFDLYQENVSIVSATPPSGEILEGTKVYLTTDTPGSKIYYTLDGSTPTTSSELYTGAGIEITRDIEINAFGHKDNLGSGPVSTFNYTVVRDENLSYGLSDLKVNPGNLSPQFSREILNYKVNVDNDTFNIDLTPTAYDGIVKINGEEILSGETRSVALIDGENDIVIGVKEKDKREKYYTIVVKKDIGGVKTTYSMRDLRFNTLFGLIFNGRIESNTVNDFTGYRIQLLVKTGKPLFKEDLSHRGEFSFPNKQLDTFDKLFGFKYRVYDNENNVVLEEELN